MSAPADTPPPREGHAPRPEGQAPEAAPAPDHVGPEDGRSPVLSMDDRKAKRRRQREAEEAALGDLPRRQAKLLRMEARRNGKGGGGRGRAPDLPAPTGDVPPLPQVGGPVALGPMRRRPADEDDDGPRPLQGAVLTPVVPRPAGPARARKRHWGVLLSFLLLVALPTALAAWYLWERASPRYASTVGFSVRTEDSASAVEMLGGIVGLGSGGSSSSDTDILYRYIQSQEIVRTIDERLDLRTLWAKGDPARDPLFAYHPPGTIEDLHDHWERMVAVYNDTGTGLLDIQVQAFAPEDARAIATAIYEESQRLINELSDIAQSDRTELARKDLEDALERLKTAREALTRFRNENQIVDPQASLQSQMGLLARLEDQLAQTLIELDLLRQNASDDDPRIQQSLARVDVIQDRMEAERAQLGLGRRGADGEAPEASEGGAFAELVAEYERLQVDHEFAQQTYVAAMASYDAALAEGRKQSRYLAAHVEPTLAERADYPQRWVLTLLTLLFAGLTWMTLVLGIYALRDRR